MQETDRQEMAEGMKNNPLVSVIMPAYNAEKYIAEAIQSVISQTYTNWQLLVIDDCSTDRTAEIAEEFEKTDQRIRALRNPKNMGVAKTRNRGLDLAEGEWVALLDSDDRWHKEKLEKQLAVAENSDEDIIYCSYALTDESGKHLSDYKVPRTTTYHDMLKECVLSCSTVLLHRGILASHHFLYDCYQEDYAFWLELLRAGYRAEACCDVLADYRIVNGSRSRNKLKSAKNRWIVYRRVEKLSLVRSIRAFMTYAFRGVMKYRGL